jgi:uncharacterized protein (UPF0332 family)
MAAQPFDWIRYYTLANELAGRADEASRRSAISRAYYYVYHLALARAISNGFQIIEGEPSHKQLWRNYSDSPEPGCRKLAEIAKRLKEKRERADYNRFYPRIDDEINHLINDAQDFAARLVTLPRRFPDPTNVRQ